MSNVTLAAPRYSFFFVLPLTSADSVKLPGQRAGVLPGGSASQAGSVPVKLVPRRTMNVYNGLMFF